ncbi:hypothetical protein [Flavobacterium degerlachei]|nr:hypothetical protein [Flavobacterium degerlachei]
MGKKDKNKKKNKEKKDADPGKLKSKCCEKYKKGEDKRCKKCPRFDLDK